MNGIVVDLTDDTPVDLSSHAGGSRGNGSVLDLHKETSNGYIGKENHDDVYDDMDLETCGKAIKTLEEELRNEETRLLLLKKIRMSQVTKTKTAMVSPTVRSNGHTSTPQRSTTTGLPAVGVGAGNGQTMLPMASKSLIRSPPYSTAQRQAGIARPIVSSQSQPGGRSQREIEAMEQQRALLQQQQQQKQLLMQKQAADVRRQQELSAQQRQAAAKQALRKQLEQTLLQIPPPKPPAPSITLVPNGNILDFLALLGLEECVELAESEKSNENTKNTADSSEIVTEAARIKCEENKADSKKSGKIGVKLPPLCQQCSTDFTPVWIELRDSSDVICERCDSSNRKQALKVEHTNRLKNAFLKALQQEQAIDQGSTSYPAADRTGSQSGSVRNAAAVTSASRSVAMSAEDLARRMIAHRASPTTASQYRSSPNQLPRSSNGVYDRPSANHGSRNNAQYDRSSNQVARQYNNYSSTSRPSNNQHVDPRSMHIDLTSGSGRYDQNASRYKVLPTDNRYLSNRSTPYNRT